MTRDIAAVDMRPATTNEMTSKAGENAITARAHHAHHPARISQDLPRSAVLHAIERDQGPRE